MNVIAKHQSRIPNRTQDQMKLLELSQTFDCVKVDEPYCDSPESQAGAFHVPFYLILLTVWDLLRDKEELCHSVTVLIIKSSKRDDMGS